MGCSERRMFVGGRLMREVMRRESRPRLMLQSKRILVRKMVMCPEGVRVEAMEMSSWRSLTSMHAAF
jgi:hypothetical protein